MNKICEKKNMTGKVEFSRFSSLLNKTKNLKEKNAKIKRRKHLHSEKKKKNNILLKESPD